MEGGKAFQAGFTELTQVYLLVFVLDGVRDYPVNCIESVVEKVVGYFRDVIALANNPMS